MRYSECLFFKQKTAYEMRISDWSSDVCSSDLLSPVDLALDSAALVLARATAHAGQRDHEVLAGGIQHGVGGDDPGHQDDRRCRPQGEAHAGHGDGAAPHGAVPVQIGSAPERERGCQYVEVSVGAVPVKQKKKHN